MLTILEVERFNPKIHLADLQSFSCGEEEWSLEVSDWIKGRHGGVLDDIREHGTEVWLYGNQDVGLIGFGSLGGMKWAYPGKNSKKQPISIIPNLAIQKSFHGLPVGDRNNRYSVQILDHLRFEAAKHAERAPAIGLYVHPGNKKALAFYTSRGFVSWSSRWTNPANELAYPGMLLNL